MAPEEAAPRRRTTAWYTPESLVDLVVEHALAGWTPRSRRLRVVDPACGDGRFLLAAAAALEAAGRTVDAVGVDVDASAIEAARRCLADGPRQRRVTLHHGDALGHGWRPGSFDLVVGNPPFLSPLSAATPRRGPQRAVMAPYADIAVEFLALALDLARPSGGRVALVLPQSVLSSRDAAAVRADVDRRTRRCWSWWSRHRVFAASVYVCALVVETTGGEDGGAQSSDGGHGRPWTAVVTESLGVPRLPPLDTAGTLGGRASLRADFRDQYYGLVPAVVDGGDGPRLVTSGLIDPGQVLWGCRTARFARRELAEPRVDTARLSSAMRSWVDRKLVPKVLVASQTRVLEAVADSAGELLPSVPVTTVMPLPLTSPDSAAAVWEIAAVLTSPVASAWAWHRCAGSGLSGRALRTGSTVLATLPWPAARLASAVDALRAGDVVACGREVDAAFGVRRAEDDELHEWWRALLPGQLAAAGAADSR